MEALKKYFPVKDIPTVLALFSAELQDNTHPNLSILSIILGAIENSLTCSRALTPHLPTNEPQVTDVDNNVSLKKQVNGIADEGKVHKCNPLLNVPMLELHHVEALYEKFVAIIKGSVDLTLFPISKYASRDLVKRVSDVVWNSLTRSYYKDKAHLQSLYSYLTGNKLDCFGVALAVVAGCHVLGYNDVHLALSEDHAWVIYGENGSETAEVTWHGKGNEDKRGQPIQLGVAAKSWLYLNGHPILCTRYMEVAAIVAAINPKISINTDSGEVAKLQQELLWVLYDIGHIVKYPMALGNLGDLEAIAPTPGRPSCTTLFEESIYAARTFYANQHVYPHTYQGMYYYRRQLYKEAMESWANAGDVIRNYNYSRDDEEVYKEFHEIATELIPIIMKTEGSGHSARSVLREPSFWANLLRFYDGICQWEEGSSTPILHIGWVKPLVSSITKFETDVRTQVDLLSESTSNGHIVTNNNNYKTNHNNDLIRNLESQTDSDVHPTIAALTEACSENILNPNYLLGSGEPFMDDNSSMSPLVIPLQEEPHMPLTPETLPPKDETPPPKEETPSPKAEFTPPKDESTPPKEEGPQPPTKPKVYFRSQKMKALREILQSEKLNTQAISLQLTAQSQVQVRGRNSLTNETSNDGAMRSKRSRRE